MATSTPLRRPLRAACATAILALAVAVPPASSAETGSLAVTTTGPDGSAVTGACFEVLRGAQSADSFCATSLGATRTLPAGEYTLKETTAPQAAGRVLRKPPDQRFTISAGQTTTLAVAHVSGAAIRITALMPDGSTPLTCFEARAGRAVEDRACTGPGGAPADLRVPAPATVTVRQTLTPDGHLPGPDVTVDTVLDTTVSRTTEMRVAPGAVRVEPVGPAGEPLTGGCWSLYAGEEYRTSDCDDDGDGAVRFTRLVPGGYVVREYLAPPGYRRAEDVPVTVGAAEEIVRPAHAPMGVTRVRAVAGENGPLVPGACWTVRLPDDTEGQVQRVCDADDGADDGVTRFDTLAEGDYVMWSGGVVDGYEPVREPQPFTAGSDDVTIVFVLRPRGGGGEPAAPVNTAAPAVTGELRVGGRLTGGNGTWTGAPTAFAYQWERCDEAGENCVLIPDATQSHHTLTRDDADKRLRLVVTASNAAGSGRAASEPTAVLRPVPPVNLVPPRANVLLNTFATADTGRWRGDGPIRYAFQWLKCDTNGDACAEIPLATLPLVGINALAEPYTLRVRVTATDSQGSTAALSAPSRLAGRARPVNRVKPSLAPHQGDYRVGDVIVARPGTWEVTHGPIRYQYYWRFCDQNGENCRIDYEQEGNRYEIKHLDHLHRISAVVFARGRDGETAEQTEQILFRAVPPVNLDPPTISGTLRVGERVTAHPGRWRSVGRNLKYRYTWVRCESDGGNCFGATDADNSNRYRIQPADWGRTLKITVQATDSEGTAWAQSTHTAVIENR